MPITTDKWESAFLSTTIHFLLLVSFRGSATFTKSLIAAQQLFYYNTFTYEFNLPNSFAQSIPVLTQLQNKEYNKVNLRYPTSNGIRTSISESSAHFHKDSEVPRWPELQAFRKNWRVGKGFVQRPRGSRTEVFDQSGDMESSERRRSEPSLSVRSEQETIGMRFSPNFRSQLFLPDYEC